MSSSRIRRPAASRSYYRGALSVRPIDVEAEAPFVPAYVELTQDEQRESLERLAIIKPLLEQCSRNRHAVERVARAATVSTATLYRWLKLYGEGGIKALAPIARGIPQGSERLDPRVEQLITACIQRGLKESSSSTAIVLHVDIKAACDRLNAEHPHARPVRYPGLATVQRRLTKMKAQYENHRGETRQVLRERKQAMVGSIEASEALELVQIDHTVLDVHAVDHETPEPIGRPTFTVAIDVHTRCVMGFALQLLPPGTLPAALCVQHMCYPKEPWLQRIGLNVEWPMFGVPQYIHTDNAREFLSHGFGYGCAEILSEHITRPRCQPRYGGTIERLIGTLMRKVRMLPGASYNDMLRKATKNPIRDARFTLQALEWDLAREIAFYHDTRHAALGIPPRQMWEQALAQRGRLSSPLPIVPADLFLIDFLPLKRRQVTKEGLALEGRHYWAEELRRYIDTETTLMVRPDLRDVRTLWVLLPGEGYLCAKLYKPAAFRGITLWDWRTWSSRHSGAPVHNHALHAQLRDESRERRAQAEAQVRAKRKEARTPIQSRKALVQNEAFLRAAPIEGSTVSAAGATTHTRNRILSGTDLSTLPPTAPSVFRKGPR
jgi:putative transposase